jgi:hypothetical protein
VLFVVGSDFLRRRQQRVQEPDAAAGGKQQ